MVRQREHAVPAAGKAGRRAAVAVDKVEGDAGPVSTTRLRRGRAPEANSVVDTHPHGPVVQSDRLDSMLLRWACEVELAATLRDENDESAATPCADVLAGERGEDVDQNAADLDSEKPRQTRQTRQASEERRLRIQDGRR